MNVALQRPGRPGLIPQASGNVLFDDMFQYAVNFTFAGNENLQSTIPIQADADFVCVLSTYDTNVTPAVAGAAFGGSLVQLTDLSTNRALQNIPVAASTLFGTAQRPFWWPFTHCFRRNGGIVVSATGIAAATVQVVRYVFAGYKIRPGSSGLPS
ncbi:MAG TPA: hypothetical protein VJL31_12970 [Gemmatimonadales bacterium]|nr:hypothetical protein [Gemmatimonadales bacterium]